MGGLGKILLFCGFFSPFFSFFHGKFPVFFPPPRFFFVINFLKLQKKKKTNRFANSFFRFLYVFSANSFFPFLFFLSLFHIFVFLFFCASKGIVLFLLCYTVVKKKEDTRNLKRDNKQLQIPSSCSKKKTNRFAHSFLRFLYVSLAISFFSRFFFSISFFHNFVFLFFCASKGIVAVLLCYTVLKKKRTLGI